MRNLETFKKKFHRIREKGFIRTQRNGSTGVGHTFEQLLGIEENNIPLPDTTIAEIKCHRANASNLITLFTFNNNAWEMPQVEAIERYGSPDQNNRMGLYYTLSLEPNNVGLSVEVKGETVTIRHTDGTVVVSWLLDDLERRFKEKIPALILVSALVDERDGTEYFHYNRARIMRGTSSEAIAKGLNAGIIYIDLRLHKKEDSLSARNHGTGFRCRMKDMPVIFTEVMEL